MMNIIEQKILVSKLKSLVKPRDINSVLAIFETFEKDNLENIERLRRNRSLDTKKISGALKNCIKAHGPITATLIGSATKRVYGALMDEPKKEITLKEFFVRVIKLMKMVKLTSTKKDGRK